MDSFWNLDTLEQERFLVPFMICHSNIVRSSSAPKGRSTGCWNYGNLAISLTHKPTVPSGDAMRGRLLRVLSSFLLRRASPYGLLYSFVSLFPVSRMLF